jgi:hypothetical protein
MAGIAMRRAVVATVVTLMFGGCGMGPEYTVSPDYPAPQVAMPSQPPAAAYANPVFIPVADPLCAWETTVAVVSDYFRIEREEPVRLVGNTLIEGSIVTAPEVSPTAFEPWRHDTADPEQRIENTLQSMRRRAVVRVIPAQGGHWVDLAVFKELEDVVRPEQATAGAATFRYDDSLVGIVNPITGQQITKGWIPRGRDTSLEQYMIAHLLSRCGQEPAPMVMRGQDK